MRLLGIELASMARADEVEGVGDGSRPVKALPKSVSIKGPRRRVVDASPPV